MRKVTYQGKVYFLEYAADQINVYLRGTSGEAIPLRNKGWADRVIAATRY